MPKFKSGDLLVRKGKIPILRVVLSVNEEEKEYTVYNFDNSGGNDGPIVDLSFFYTEETYKKAE